MTVTARERKTADRHRAKQLSSGLLTAERKGGTTGRRPRNRSWGLVSLSALLVVGMGLAVAAWGLHAGDREEVLALGEPVSKGQIIKRSDLVSASVAGVTGAIPVSDIALVVDKTAAVDLVVGQIVTSQMMTGTAVPAAGQATVGLALDPTRVPAAGLDPGDVVEVVAVPSADGVRSGTASIDQPEILTAEAQVYAVDGAPAAGGQVLLTLVVNAEAAVRIAAYSTQNRVAVIESAPSTDPGDIGAEGP